jgi:trans-aconitate methyltransferase
MYGRNARFVSELGAPVLELLAPQAGERVLDLGCGDGVLTMKLRECGCTVIGVDASAEMVRAAQSLGLDARTMDGRSLEFSEEFDAVFSNAALHWMTEPARVIDGVWRALRPGGRFVGELGGHGNVATLIEALEAEMRSRGAWVDCPWYFPRPEAYQASLEARGFEVRSIELFPRPTRLPGDVGGWLETFAGPYTTVLPEGDRRTFVAAIVERLRGTLRAADGNWYADYVRLRFSATKPD